MLLFLPKKSRFLVKLLSIFTACTICLDSSMGALPIGDGALEKMNGIGELPNGDSKQEYADVDVLKKLKQETKLLETKLAQLESRLQLKQKVFKPVAQLSSDKRHRILVTGGAGFVGSHLVDRLMLMGHEVIALDNFFTGQRKNIRHWIGHPNFELVHHDVVNQYHVEVDRIYHLASPASPPHYMYNPIKTIKTNTVGTLNMLGLARRVKARILLASTSEVYGDPEVHPQPETYWGNVNPIGPRACYDEGKRVAETIMYAYQQQERVQIRVARIFNTFGPRMHLNDGRVVSNFIVQALRREPLTIYGTGEQTRSFQYVSDLVDGLIALMESDVTMPVNLGNPEEHKISEFAEIVRDLTNSSSSMVNNKKVIDDPQQRRPDISRAKELIGWSPKVRMIDGLKQTIEYFQTELQRENEDQILEAQDGCAVRHPAVFTDAAD